MPDKHGNDGPVNAALQLHLRVASINQIDIPMDILITQSAVNCIHNRRPANINFDDREWHDRQVLNFCRSLRCTEKGVKTIRGEKLICNIVLMFKKFLRRGMLNV